VVEGAEVHGVVILLANGLFTGIVVIEDDDAGLLRRLSDCVLVPSSALR
jgi:hypothetical protein